VLTARDVTDVAGVDGVADPFLFPADDGGWHLFVEVFARDRDPTAAIGHATSPDGRDWTYQGLVVATDDHLSFPYVFRWDGEHYLLPDPWSKRDREATITLYRARSFPSTWEPVAALLTPDRSIHDMVVFRWGDRWWGLAGDRGDLYAYHSASLEADGWTPHEANPVVEGRLAAGRPAGRPIVRPDQVLAFFQDGVRRYGHRVRAFRITELTPTTYADREVRESPVLEPSGRRVGWNSGGMHHIDPWHVGDGWVCAVDGDVQAGRGLFGDMWAVGLYRSR
jgi:hypothetical protein